MYVKTSKSSSSVKFSGANHLSPWASQVRASGLKLPVRKKVKPGTVATCTVIMIGQSERAGEDPLLPVGDRTGAQGGVVAENNGFGFNRIVRTSLQNH